MTTFIRAMLRLHVQGGYYGDSSRLDSSWRRKPVVECTSQKWDLDNILMDFTGNMLTVATG